MQDYNIRLKRYNGVDYDNLYPETKTNLLIGDIQKSQLADGATYTALTGTLYTNSWNTTTLEQTISVQGVDSNSVIIVAPDVNNIEEYSSNRIYCIAQNTDSLTFQCTFLPESDISVNILILT